MSYPARISFLIVTLTVMCLNAAPGQQLSPLFHPVYNDSVVATIRITIAPDSLAAIYDPANADSDHEYPATFMFDNGIISDTLYNIGFRLRGNTSRDSRKKSFKISINSFEHGRKFFGLEKLNLNGEHNDPSIVRSKLCWELYAASGAFGSRASHTRVFINNIYYGLYINTEHVDENFVLDRFGNNDGNLYKCLWPAELAYLGSDPNLYKLTSGNRRVYELTINEEIDDYSDLAHFISVLNQTPTGEFTLAIQRVFNVNGFLRALAVDVAAGNWDNYWFNKNNYYLYHNIASDKFEYIPYDVDNTFGVWWTTIMPGVDWGTRSVYAWGHPSEQRPLTARLFAVQEFRNRFSFYLNRLLQRNFIEGKMFQRIDSIHTMITAAAEADSFRTLDYGFTIQQFHNSYTQALGQHVPYGLKPYITTRRNSALSQLTALNVPPILSDLVHTPHYPFGNDPISFSIRVEDEAITSLVLLHYRIGAGAWQTPVSMFDDGLHNDGTAGDEVFGVTLTGFPADALVEYFVTGTDAQSQTSVEPPDAPATLHRFRVSGAVPKMYINEFMSKNDTTILDPFGELEDWIEIYNGDTVAIRLKNWYLSDNFSNPKKWRFPDTTVAVGAFLLVWADEDSSQGPLHASFKLDRDGERIGLYRGDSISVSVVDTVSFGHQQSDEALGRMPDGGVVWQVMAHATPGYANHPTGVSEQKVVPLRFSLSAPYPNPFNPAANVKFQIPNSGWVTLKVYDLLGREVATLVQENLKPGEYVRRFDAGNLSSGIYLCRLQSERSAAVVRMILMK